MKPREPAAPNLLDKAIEYFAPRVAARRAMARVQVAALSGGYVGARRDRASLAAMSAMPGSPTNDVIGDLPTLRARSADLERNAPVAAGVINTSALHIVGTGLALNPQIDAEFLRLSPEEADAWQVNTRRRFRAWFESPDCSLDRRLNGYGLQELALRSTMGRGDVFCVTPRVARPGKPTRLALQLIEADLCSTPSGMRDSDTLTDGVECSADTGEAIAYHFANRYANDLATGGKARTWTRREARGANGRLNVLHLYRVLRPSLRRGVPILAPVIEPLKQITRFAEAELNAAVVSGLFAVFFKMDPQAFADMFDEKDQKTYIDSASKWSGELESGKAVNLLPGEEPISVNPARPNAQFDPFMSSCIRQIGMAVGIPYEVLVMHYQSSYTAARGALLTAWRFFMSWRDWLSTNFCQPVYELWLAEEVAEGRISAPGFFADDVVRAAWCGAQWVGDGPGSIDPVKEVTGAKGRVELGISTLQAESILHDGVDWETKQRQRVKEIKRQREDGTLPPEPAAVPGAPAPAPAPQSDDD